MQTELADFIKDTDIGKEADSILRNCVHCGFCTATCPTYQQSGDELDGPRGRIYLIKQMLEGHEATAKTQMHLDRCLTCRACETTCPSGVKYGRLVEIGREFIDQRVERPLHDRITRSAILNILPYPKRMAPLLKLGQIFKPVLPESIRRIIPETQKNVQWPTTHRNRQMLVLGGCAQSVVKAGTNSAAAKILDKLGITLITAPSAGCCGAVSYHMTEHEAGLAFMRRNIDAWWPFIQSGCEAIVVSASGCGAMVKEYGELLKNDFDYAEKAAKIASLAKDPSEIIAAEDLSHLKFDTRGLKVAFQAPCSLQHAQKINGGVEAILTQLGFELTPVADAHLCCGSAGTYSILQKEMSQKLLDGKISTLMSGNPDVIATANIGCHMHLESKAGIPVKHWLELIAESLQHHE